MVLFVISRTASCSTAILGKIEEAAIHGKTVVRADFRSLGSNKPRRKCVGFLKLPVIDFEVSIDRATPASKVVCKLSPGES